MPKFIPREKLSKKARRSLDAEKRATWGFSPVTRKVENKALQPQETAPCPRRRGCFAFSVRNCGRLYGI